MGYDMWVKKVLSDKSPEDYVSLEEICKSIEIEYGITKLELKDIPHLQMHCFNALHSYGNEQLAITKEQLNIEGISLPITTKTKCYMEGNYTPKKIGIYLVYEDQIGYHYSNSERLQLEVLIARGVTEEDVRKNTERYNVWKKCCVRYWHFTGIEIGNIEEWKKIYYMELE